MKNVQALAAPERPAAIRDAETPRARIVRHRDHPRVHHAQTRVTPPWPQIRPATHSPHRGCAKARARPPVRTTSSASQAPPTEPTSWHYSPRTLRKLSANGRRVCISSWRSCTAGFQIQLRSSSFMFQRAKLVPRPRDLHPPPRENMQRRIVRQVIRHGFETTTNHVFRHRQPEFVQAPHATPRPESLSSRHDHTG